MASDILENIGIQLSTSKTKQFDRKPRQIYEYAMNSQYVNLEISPISLLKHGDSISDVVPTFTVSTSSLPLLGAGGSREASSLYASVSSGRQEGSSS
jgi:hypothetical protein